MTVKFHYVKETGKATCIVYSTTSRTELKEWAAKNGYETMKVQVGDRGIPHLAITAFRSKGKAIAAAEFKQDVKAWKKAAKKAEPRADDGLAEAEALLKKTSESFPSPYFSPPAPRPREMLKEKIVEPRAVKLEKFEEPEVPEYVETALEETPEPEDSPVEPKAPEEVDLELAVRMIGNSVRMELRIEGCAVVLTKEQAENLANLLTAHASILPE